MAIAFDAAGRTDDGSGTTTGTASHTCTGDNRILFVQAISNDDGDTVTGVTYNGVSMSKIGSSVGVPPASSSSNFLSMWYLIAPATGANNVVVTRSTTPATNIIISVASYTGAAQSGQPDASNTGTGTSVSSLSISTTTIADNCWTLASFANNGGGTWTATTGTSRIAGNVIWLDSNAAVTPAGSSTLAASVATQNVGGIMVSFAPAVASAVTPTQMMMGIGT